MSSELERKDRAESLAIAAQTLAVLAQGALLILGVTGLLWGYIAGGFWRPVFGTLCLVLALLSLRISSVSFDTAKGVVRLNTRKT